MTNTNNLTTHHLTIPIKHEDIAKLKEITAVITWVGGWVQKKSWGGNIRQHFFLQQCVSFKLLTRPSVDTDGRLYIRAAILIYGRSSISKDGHPYL